MTNNKDVELWDYHQTNNAAHLVPGHIRQEMLSNKINKYVKGGRLLEIGFGDGYLLSRLKDKFECYGADISEVNIEKIKKILDSVKFSVVDIDGSLPFENHYFNAFVASEVLEHMDDKELKYTISEIIRVLKKGGYAFVTVPAEENLKDSECFCPNCRLRFHKWGHKQTWNEKKIRSIFSDFQIIKISEYYNRFVGKNKFENVMGILMQTLQAVLNIFIKFPNKIYRNRIYVIVLKK